jgi:hypothetical protein
LKTWATNQSVVALSIGEAELYALTKGASQTLGVLSMGRDFGLLLTGTVHTDSTAAIGMTYRVGLGKVRHLRVQYLWRQEKVADNDLWLEKVLGNLNPADSMTKGLAREPLEKHLTRLGYHYQSGRAKSAPTIGGIDVWRGDTGGVWKREHRSTRCALFTPYGHTGGPTRSPYRSMAVGEVRRTVGVYVDNCEEVEPVDRWKDKEEAHRDMGRPWVGSTTFTTTK